MLTASFQGLVQYVWHDSCGIVGSIHTCCIAPGWFGAVRYLLLYEFGDGWQGNEQKRCSTLRLSFHSPRDAIFMDRTGIELYG